MWVLPGPGLEPVSPALAGGLPTTVPPGKSQVTYMYSRLQSLVGFDIANIFFQFVAC